MKKLTSCIVCGDSHFSFLFKTEDRMFSIKGTFTLKKCISCGLAFINPQPTSRILKRHYPNRKYYSYKPDSQEDFFGRIRTYLSKRYYQPTIISKIFSSLIQNVPAMPSYKKNGKLLDVGCGAGDTIVLLKELGWEVYGLEIDRKAVEIAKRKGFTQVRLGSYKNINDYPDNYFDVVRLYHVIEHLPNPNLCLQLIYKKLKQGGELIIGTPNFESFTSKIFKKFWFNLDTPRHLFIFSPKTLSKITAKYGFSQTRIEFCSGGGIIRSINYAFNQIAKRKLSFINSLFFFFLLYPLEWTLDKLKVGDIFILRAIKEK